MKISDLVEQIFATAVALDQSGGLKNTIYAIDNEIYILNYDHTVLLRFVLRKSENPFETPISFKANDYDSNEFEERDGQIVFFSKKEGYVREKSCGTTDLTPQEVRKMFNSFKEKKEGFSKSLLDNDVIALLDDNLSHIEFSGEKGKQMVMKQRNIYSGGVIEIRKTTESFFKEKMENNFGPLALKTNDFKALFNFQNSLFFTFPHRKKEDFIWVKSADKGKRNFTGIVACCIYDEIIKLKEATNGGQEQKIRRNK